MATALTASPTASETRSSISLSSSSHSPHQTYSSPRHPGYLAHTSPGGQSTSTSTSATGSAYSRYTTQSQVGRVQEVLQEKVFNTIVEQDEHEERGAALKRLIAFLDGEDTAPPPPVQVLEQHDRQHEERELHYDVGSNEQAREQERHGEAVDEQYTPPRRRNSPLASQTHAQQHQQPIYIQQPQASSFYSQQMHQGLQEPATPPSRGHSQPQPHQQPQPNNTTRLPFPGAVSHNNTRTPRFPSHQQYFQQTQQPFQYTERRPNSAPQVAAPSSIYESRAQSGPSVSILLSTQAQLQKLKSEVSQLDELVNRLKVHDGRLGANAGHQNEPIRGQGEEGDLANLHDSHAGRLAQVHHHDHDHVDEHAETSAQAEQRARHEEEEQKTAAMEAERLERQRILEEEAACISEDEVLQFVRYIDSLVWMRRPATAATDGTANANAGTTPFSLGHGPRADEVIFAKGNIKHLMRRVKAWEGVVRGKEEEEYGQRLFR